MKPTRRQTVVSFFNQQYLWWSSVYDSHYPRGFFSFEMIRRRQAVLSEVERCIGKRRRLRILECGCGPGGLLKHLPLDEQQVVGIDINSDFVAGLREECPQAQLVCGDLEALPFESESFDLVICVGVLSYLPGDERALAEMARLIRPGGHLVVANPNLFMLDKLCDPYYLLAWPLRYLWRAVGRQSAKQPEQFNARLIRRYRHRQLDGLYRQHGFATVNQIGTSFGPLRFWRKDCLSLQRSIRISDGLAELASRQSFRFLDRLANHWVTSLVKQYATAGGGG